MAHMILDLVASFGSCLNCLPGSPTLKINSRSFKILRLLGEANTSTAEVFALKKIRCPFGAESVAQAMKEVEAYRAFAGTPGIIHSIDYSIATERGSAADDSSKTVYVLLPYYKRGNLQDMINANLVNGTHFPERKLMHLFLGVCRALKAMHQYNGPRSGAAPARSMERMRMGSEADDPLLASDSNAPASPPRAPPRADADDDHAPLMGSSSSAALARSSAFAHRDIKPGNIMIADNGTDPVLMDLGSVAAAPLPITSHSQAIAVQDTAAEHSTMPYRAPELFDVRTGSVVDTKVDIWSLGCTLYACLVGKSPFEARSDETGGSLSLCVLGGDWRFPDEGPSSVQRQNTAAKQQQQQQQQQQQTQTQGGGAKEATISEPVKDIVRKCLAVEPAERPDIDELIQMVENAMDLVSDD
ncbi:hypothetical protein TD95_004778 [Thielaviopsis punctulata]|uniref:non-specific serine/threonine protein kinase n=1 Tax=Thielaviopsis punctulata TaxID=72032 RepID=A0A0F4ZJ53_9PEZI|nr:hypothetical protein TD95_004778 [Thielaviopsis punctulata]